MREYNDEAFCDHCDKDTPHHIIDSEHERDSSGDSRTCLICKWTWRGYTGDYEPPFENDEPKSTWTRAEVEKLTEEAFAEGMTASRGTLPTPRTRYDLWKSKNII